MARILNKLTTKSTTRVKLWFIYSRYWLSHLKPISNIPHKANWRKRHSNSSNKDRIRRSPLLQHRLNFLEQPPAQSGSPSLHFPLQWLWFQYAKGGAGNVHELWFNTGMWVTESRHCQPCATADSRYCGDTSLHWLNKTEPTVVVNQHTVEDNFTLGQSSITVYCSGWVQQQQLPLRLLPNMDPAVERGDKTVSVSYDLDVFFTLHF